ncbi:MAG: 16S rRNA (cytosine(967)-C(5))-methyltransferase RsmB [Deltaproteobacteria bacterium]|nr:16S rRNA (cytosine(967)-C(5))-methyltransferase RsmB [Deltaproteobacteria bacterium]
MTSRQVALETLLRIERKQETLRSGLTWAFHQHKVNDPREKALIGQLVFGVTRFRSRLDFIINCHSRITARKMDPVVRNALRLGAFQIRFLTRIPGFAAVNEVVEMVKVGQPAKVSGFVNAVLRDLIRSPQSEIIPDETADPVNYLAITTSNPNWLVAHFISELGQTEAAALLTANNLQAPITIRVNTRRIARNKLAAILSDLAEKVEPGQFLPDALHVYSPIQPLEETPMFRAGLFLIQDEASQLVGHLAAPDKGQMVLDICAGAGIKATYLAQHAGDEAIVVAVDIHRGRLAELRQNAKRLGAKSIVAIAADAVAPPFGVQVKFDRILLDAPCSGLGVIRRRPDVKWNKTASDLTRLPALQSRFLESVAPYLKPGGRLIYATCTLNQAENQQVIHEFVKGHPNYRIIPVTQILSSTCSKLTSREGLLVTVTHHHGIDTFFAAVLTRHE